MQTIGRPAGPLEVVLQHRPEIGMGAAFDDQFRALLRREPAQIGQTLLGHENLHVLIDVIDMADHRHDGRNRAALRQRRAHEDRDPGIAREIARTADAVLHARTHDVGRVDVAVDVGLDQAVHGDAAKPADQFGVIADLLRAQDDAVAVAGYVVIQAVGIVGAQRKGGGRGDAQLAAVEQVDHPVLDHLGKGRHPLERTLDQPGQHGIGDIADAGLQRQQRRRQAALSDLVAEEIENVPGNPCVTSSGCLERLVAVGRIGFDHGDDLGRIAAEGGRADAVLGPQAAGSARGWAAAPRRARCRAFPPDRAIASG
jgi:hypothetical protein